MAKFYLPVRVRKKIVTLNLFIPYVIGISSILTTINN
jgi:hypothetical protein